MDRSCRPHAVLVCLNGQKTGNLPVIQAQEFELFINKSRRGRSSSRIQFAILAKWIDE